MPNPTINTILFVFFFPYWLTDLLPVSAEISHHLGEAQIGYGELLARQAEAA